VKKGFVRQKVLRDRTRYRLKMGTTYEELKVK